MSGEQIEVRHSDDGIEHDENGIPYYKWPPFPRIPESFNIIPFKDFKPAGIQIQLGDDIELDGLGIPTVRLQIAHDNDAPPKKKKKTKKNYTGEEIRRTSIWWQDWAEGEPQRIRSARMYNNMDDAETRLARAAEEFKSIHDWGLASNRLLEWWQRFLYSLGLNDTSVKPRFIRSQTEDLQDEEDSDDEVVVDSNATSNQPKRPSPVTIGSFDEGKHKLANQGFTIESDERFQQRVQNIKDKQQLRRLRFIDDPEREIKIFFSSAFRDSGMMWETMALRDAPHLVEFFLDYILKIRAFPENDASLKLALKVARKAIVELPLTKEIGFNMPDNLAHCLKATFGSHLEETPWPIEPELEAQPEAQAMESGGEVISGDIESPSDIANGNTEGLTQIDETGGWSGADFDVAGKWGAAPTDGDNIDDITDNPWAQSSSNKAWDIPDVHSLMALVGPTSLPITHTIGYVEDSTRYISTVTLPEVKPTKKDATHTKEVCTSSDFFNSFAHVVLKAYPAFADASAPRAAIQPPKLLEDPWSGISSDLDYEDASTDVKRPRVPRHDPQKDSITLLIDPKVAKDIASGRGMGLGGTFVQIIPDHTSEPASRGETGRGRGSRGRGSGQGGKGQAAKDVSFWYAEKIMQIIPSFWTENLRQ